MTKTPQQIEFHDDAADLRAKLHGELTHVYVVEFSEYSRRGLRVFATLPTPEDLREAYLSVGVEWARQELQAHHIRLGTPPTDEAMAACVNDVEVGPDFEFHITERSVGDVRAFMTVFGRHCSEIQILVSHMPLMGVS